MTNMAMFQNLTSKEQLEASIYRLLKFLSKSIRYLLKTVHQSSCFDEIEDLMAFRYLQVYSRALKVQKCNFCRQKYDF